MGLHYGVTLWSYITQEFRWFDNERQQCAFVYNDILSLFSKRLGMLNCLETSSSSITYFSLF
jgi:hypothetical protein